MSYVHSETLGGGLTAATSDQVDTRFTASPPAYMMAVGSNVVGNCTIITRCSGSSMDRHPVSGDMKARGIIEAASDDEHPIGTNVNVEPSQEIPFSAIEKPQKKNPVLKARVCEWAQKKFFFISYFGTE